MYCPHCGVNNDRGESSCYICGKPLPPMAAVAAESPGRSQRRQAVGVAADTNATVGDRTLALLFDRGLIVAGMVLLAAWQTSSAGSVDPQSTWIVGTGAAIFVGTTFLYHALLEGVIGTTLGKAMMGLRVEAIGGRGRFVAALLRNVLRIVDAIAMYLVGFLFAMFTRRRQRVGDLVASTVVVERQANRALRAVLMVLWLVVVGVALWTAQGLCPKCVIDTRGLERVNLVR